MKDLAVLIPAYNDQEGLLRTLASIREPDESFTVVIVDDGSADPVEVDPGLYKFKVVVRRLEENGGIVAALIHGWDYIASRGFSVLARLDAADLCRPGRLDRQYRMLSERSGLALVGSDAVFRDMETGRAIFSTRLPVDSEGVRRWMAFRNCFIHPTVMIRLDRVPPTLRYRRRYPHIEDYVLFAEIAEKHECANIAEPLVDCFVRESGISRSNDRRQLLSGLRFRVEHPRPLNPLWYACLVKKSVYLVTPFRWRTVIKRRFRFVKPPKEEGPAGQPAMHKVVE